MIYCDWKLKFCWTHGKLTVVVCAAAAAAAAAIVVVVVVCGTNTQHPH